VNEYIIASSKEWDKENFNKHFRNEKGHHFVSTPKELNLTLKNIQKLKHIFFTHWSEYIPEEIFNTHSCIVFHMTDLPFGRGGSPLQNLILRGLKTTKISAIKVVKDFDAGEIYLKSPLDLSGSAGEIFKRSSEIIFSSMIPEIMNSSITPVEQNGTPTVFKRRKPEQSNISKVNSIQEVYDHIRMLDAETYPKAFLELDGLKIEFTNAKIENGDCIAKVRIIKNEI